MISVDELRAMTPDAKSALAATYEQMAGEFVGDPEKGLAAGYRPARPLRYSRVTDVSSPPTRFEGSQYAEWLKAIASRELPPRTWRVDVGMGDFVGSSRLTIF